MSYIAPDSTVILCRNVPLDGTYRHTFLFESAAQQAAAFKKFKKWEFNNQTYVRVNSNTFKADQWADRLYDCNYMMFQNTAYGGKWFYAFVTAVEYVNNNCTLVSFELDVLQTWLFDFEFEKCFIERQHAPTDEVGDNLVEDNLPLGDTRPDLRYESHYPLYEFWPMRNLGILVTKAADTGETDIAMGGPSGLIAGQFTGLQYVMMELDNQDDIDYLLEYLEALGNAGQADVIVSLTMIPTFLFTYDEEPPKYAWSIPKRITKDVNSFMGYYPKNNKLYTYPYNYLHAESTDGAVQTYRFEWFEDSACEFEILGSLSPNPEVLCIPRNYCGEAENFREALTCSGYPQCAFSVDAYKAWQAMNGVDNMLGAAANGIGVVSSLLGGNITGALQGLLGVAGNINNDIKAQNQPNQARGTTGNSTLAATRDKGFRIRAWGVDATHARMIDDYWQMYGYPYYRLEYPNITSRKYWNYLKTTDCNITGSLPYQAMIEIKNIINNGITFWHGTLDNVGVYRDENPIV